MPTTQRTCSLIAGTDTFTIGDPSAGADATFVLGGGAIPSTHDDRPVETQWLINIVGTTAADALSRLQKLGRILTAATYYRTAPEQYDSLRPRVLFQPFGSNRSTPLVRSLLDATVPDVPAGLIDTDLQAIPPGINGVAVSFQSGGWWLPSEVSDYDRVTSASVANGSVMSLNFGTTLHGIASPARVTVAGNYPPTSSGFLNMPLSALLVSKQGGIQVVAGSSWTNDATWVNNNQSAQKARDTFVLRGTLSAGVTSTTPQHTGGFSVSGRQTVVTKIAVRTAGVSVRIAAILDNLENGQSLVSPEEVVSGGSTTNPQIVIFREIAINSVSTRLRYRVTASAAATVDIETSYLVDTTRPEHGVRILEPFTLNSSPTGFVLDFQPTYRPRVAITGKFVGARGRLPVQVPAQTAAGADANLDAVYVGTYSTNWRIVDAASAVTNYVLTLDRYRAYRMPE